MTTTKDGRVFADEYKDHSFAPGYRDVSLRFQTNDGGKTEEVEIHLSKKDTMRLLEDLQNVQEVAWRGDGPIDLEPTETKDGRKG